MSFANTNIAIAKEEHDAALAQDVCTKLGFNSGNLTQDIRDSLIHIESRSAVLRAEVASSAAGGSKTDTQADGSDE